MQPNSLFALLRAFAFLLSLASLPFHFAVPCLSLPAVSLGCGTRCIEDKLPLAMQGAPLIRYCHNDDTAEAMIAWECTQSLVLYSSNTLSPLAVLLSLLVGLVRSCCHVGLANPIYVAGDLAVMVICRTERLYRL